MATTAPFNYAKLKKLIDNARKSTENVDFIAHLETFIRQSETPTIDLDFRDFVILQKLQK